MFFYYILNTLYACANYVCKSVLNLRGFPTPREIGWQIKRKLISERGERRWRARNEGNKKYPLKRRWPRK
tara:strand:- start:211 stop:420 length:210 start_codon:yes stop_codon:yes gene_type:complete